MKDLLELDQAARIHRAESRWLDRSAARLRRATAERREQRSTDATEADR